MTGEDVLQEKGILEKAATIKKVEYLSLGSQLKNKTDSAKKALREGFKD